MFPRRWSLVVFLAALAAGLTLIAALSPSIAEAANAPTVTSIAPPTGPSTGGTAVTITGTDFVAGATVTIGGAAATGVNVVNSTQITATTGAATAGPAIVVVTNADSQSGTLAGGFTYLGPAPTATVVGPNTGPSSGGTAVTITGTNFVTGALVSFGGTLATGVTVVGPTQITATTPAHTTGAVNVVVTNPDTQSGTLLNGFTYTAAAAPTVTAVSPSSGTTGGGTPVTIIGTGFVSGATVKFGGTAATSVSVTNATTVTAVTPARSAGVVAVAVTNPDTQTGTLASAYTYVATAKPAVTAVSPATGPITGGTSITITGTNFLAGAAVEVGGTAATAVTVLSSTSITATTPARSTTGPVAVKVTNTDAQSGTLASPAFTYVGPPKVTDVAPSSGSIGGGTTVKITGSGFLTGATVTFDGVAATAVSVVSATEISAKTPAHAAGKVEVIVKNLDAQTGSKIDAYTYAPGPTLTSVTPLSGPNTGGTTVTITGTNFSSGATVKFGEVAGTSVSVAADGKSLTVKTPAQAAGSVDVTLTNGDGQTVEFALPFVYLLAEGQIVGGSVPGPGSIGLIVFSGGSNDQLIAAAVAGGCPSSGQLTFNSLLNGKWLTFIPAAPAVVNVAWNSRFSAGLPPTLPLFVRCLAS